MEKSTDILSIIKIRNVTAIDLPALEWEGEYKHFRRLYAEAFRRAQIGESVLWLVELPDSIVIGQVFIHLSSERRELADGKHRAYIYGFRVRPEYRNLGIGSELMRTAEEDLVKRGFRSATLNVSRDNDGARRLYERLGYRIVGGDPGRWSYFDDMGIRHDVVEPAWRMEKTL